jgi:lysophospholipase L1-like esterase
LDPVYRSYVAIGDSFTEGVGDELPDGRVRGWADFVALGLAAATEAVDYANLAVRGRKLRPLLDEQLAPALALGPELLSINGGGNDVIRPRVSIPEIARTLLDAARTAAASGVHVVLLSSANPSRHLPGGRLVQRRGDELAAVVTSKLPIAGVTYVDNWSDPQLAHGGYWSADGLHLNALGHARVASNVLTALGVPVPVEWGVEDVAAAAAGARRRNTAAYYRTYVLPWIGRRLTGRSSGDGRTAKFAQPITVTPGMSV